MGESRYDTGMRTRREVLGDAHVDRASQAVTGFDARFQEFITEVAWGTVWSNDRLDRPVRSLITIAILASLGRTDELAMHIRASQRTGVPPEQIAEALHHVAVYAGIPAANTAFKVAKRELEETPEGDEPAPE